VIRDDDDDDDTLMRFEVMISANPNRTVETSDFNPDVEDKRKGKVVPVL
jgi:hypothetical protein